MQALTLRYQRPAAQQRSLLRRFQLATKGIQLTNTVINLERAFTPAMPKADLPFSANPATITIRNYGDMTAAQTVQTT